MRHGARRHLPAAFLERRRIHSGHIGEFGRRRPGAEGTHRDSRAVQLIGERFAQREHISFCGIVHGHQRPGLEGGCGCHHQNSPAAPSAHLRKKEPRELRQRRDVHLDHCRIPVRRRVGEEPKSAESRIINQHFHDAAALPHRGGELPRSRRIGEITDTPLGLAAGGANLLGECTELRLAARRQHDAMPRARQLKGKLATDAAARARDERHGSPRIRRVNHGRAS